MIPYIGPEGVFEYEKEKIIMKKIIAMLLVFVMLFALSATAMADEAPAEDEKASLKVLSWFSAWRGINQAGIDGTFLKVGDLEVDVWMPDLLSAQAELEDDTYFLYADSTGNASIKAHHVGLDGATTLEEVEKDVVDAGCVSDGIYEINGFRVLVYENKGNDSINAVILITDDNSGVEFVFTGVSNQDMYSLSSLVLASIQRHTLDIEDVALMMDEDLVSYWGENRHVTYAKDGSDITVDLWDDGIDADTIKNVNNWDDLKQSKITLCSLYANVLENFHMDNIKMIVQYTDAKEELRFLTIEDGEVTFDYFAQ